MEDKKSDLEIMFKDGVTVEVGGEKIQVRKMKTKQFLDISDNWETIQNAYLNNRHFVVNEDGKEEEVFDVISAVIGSFKVFIKVISVLTNKPVEFIEELDVDEVVLLASKVLEVNKQNFLEVILPRFKEMLPKVQAEKQTTGA